MAYHVKVARSALSDAEQAYAWMKERHSEDQATRWYNGLVEAVFSLESFPRRCPLAPESDEIGVELRQHLYGKRSAAYRIVFTVEETAEGEGVVQIFCIWHGARDRIKASDLDREGSDEFIE